MKKVIFAVFTAAMFVAGLSLPAWSQMQGQSQSFGQSESFSQSMASAPTHITVTPGMSGQTQITINPPGSRLAESAPGAVGYGAQSSMAYQQQAFPQQQQPFVGTSGMQSYQAPMAGTAQGAINVHITPLMPGQQFRSQQRTGYRADITAEPTGRVEGGPLSTPSGDAERQRYASKEAYTQRVESQLATWDRNVRRKPDAKQDAVSEYWSRRDNLQSQLKELRSAPETDWLNERYRTEEALNSLGTAYSRVFAG